MSGTANGSLVTDLEKIAEVLEGKGVVKLIEVTKLDLRPDECLIVQCDPDTSTNSIDNLGKFLKSIFGEAAGKRIIVYRSETRFEFTKVKIPAQSGGDTDGTT